MPLPRCRPGFTDHIYKTAHGVRLPLRVWPAQNLGASKGGKGGKGGAPAPWLLWVHGGGYTCGKWTTPTPWILSAFPSRDWTVVSVGYRLQPQASIQDMVTDTLDAVSWCQTHLPALGVEADRWAVGGASSGATIAAMVSHLAETKPRAFVNVYGLVDTPDYLSEDAARAAAAPDYLVATEDEMADAVRDIDPANAVTQNPWAEEMPPNVPLQEARDHFGLPDWEPSREQYARVDLYSHVARHRNLIDVIYRRHLFEGEAAHSSTPQPRSEAFISHVRSFSPHHLLLSPTLEAAGASAFPPTFFMHGTADNIVRVQQSYNFAERLLELGVEYDERYDEGKGHVYDFGFEKPGDAGWDFNIEPCMRFVDKHVKYA